MWHYSDEIRLEIQKKSKALRLFYCRSSKMEIIYCKGAIDTQDIKFTYPKDSYKDKLLLILSKVLD